MTTDKLPPWHPEVIDQSEVTPPTLEELITFRNMVRGIADILEQLDIPSRYKYISNDGQKRLWVGRRATRHKEHLFVAYSEIQLNPHSSITIYTINEMPNGELDISLDKATPMDYIARLSHHPLTTKPESRVPHQFTPNTTLEDKVPSLVEQTRPASAASQPLEAIVPGLGGQGVSRDVLYAIMNDLNTSWPPRQVELRRMAGYYR